jgi:uncharacterized membrane protein
MVTGAAVVAAVVGTAVAAALVGAAVAAGVAAEAQALKSKPIVSKTDITINNFLFFIFFSYSQVYF